MDCVWRGVDDCGFLKTLSIYPLASHGVAGSHHWQGFPLRLTQATAGLPHPELHCVGRAADGHLLRLPWRLVQVISEEKWWRHGAGDGMMSHSGVDHSVDSGMKLGAVLLAVVFLAGPSIPVVKYQRPVQAQ